MLEVIQESRDAALLSSALTIAIIAPVIYSKRLGERFAALDPKLRKNAKWKLFVFAVGVPQPSTTGELTSTRELCKKPPTLAETTARFNTLRALLRPPASRHAISN